MLPSPYNLRSCSADWRRKSDRARSDNCLPASAGIPLKDAAPAYCHFPYGMSHQRSHKRTEAAPPKPHKNAKEHPETHSQKAVQPFLYRKFRHQKHPENKINARRQTAHVSKVCTVDTGCSEKRSAAAGSGISFSGRSVLQTAAAVADRW